MAAMVDEQPDTREATTEEREELQALIALAMPSATPEEQAGEFEVACLAADLALEYWRALAWRAAHPTSQ